MQISPVNSTFPSEQILSKKESNGQTRIQKPYEIRIRDQKVAGSNPVTSTTKIRICESKSGFFCCAFLLEPDAGGQSSFRPQADDNGLWRIDAWLVWFDTSFRSGLVTTRISMR